MRQPRPYEAGLERVGGLISMHSHANIAVLDKFWESSGALFYSSNKIVFDESLDSFREHLRNATIHVTQADKNLWNSILQTAKDYAKGLFDQLNSFEIKRVTQLPTGNPGDEINDHCIYFLRVGGNVNSNVHDEYMYINGKWEIIGTTAINYDDLLAPYLTIEGFNTYIADYYSKSEVDEILLDYYNKTEIDGFFQTLTGDVQSIHTHDNLAALDKISDSEGELAYDGEVIKERFSNSDIVAAMVYLWPELFVSDFASSDNKIIITSDGKIFKPKEASGNE